ncbi:thymidylate kinase protein [Rutstroemia sp. NJR-2017a WRK4]|nr:thymidylate kinase protein [Rutstroemia sp. NJR-2017a WRK4]
MTTHMPMAAARQPFAPLDGSRLQNLTSLKNRQNAVSSTQTSPGKRKATTAFELDEDSENVAPIIFGSPKRSKAIDGMNKDNDSLSKPSQFFLTKAPPSPTESCLTSPLKPTKPHRTMLQPTSRTPKINSTSVSKPSPLSAPAGRSPTRKRVGILNNRRRTTNSPITRVNPPKFSTSTASGLSFSIDAALSGTIPSYGARQRQRAASSSSKSSTSDAIPSSLHSNEPKSSWFFQIHEDTEEELATNLMEHSTCTLDISSDEESALRVREFEKCEKENIPPVDDISQTRLMTTASTSEGSMGMSMKMKTKMQRKRREAVDVNAIDVDRAPLGEMKKEDFYAEGCDERSVFIVFPDPEEAETDTEDASSSMPVPEREKLVKGKERERETEIDLLMQKRVVEEIEKPEDDFVVWESGSAKGDE